MGRGVKMLHTYIQTYRQTYRHTDPLTKWVVEELSLLKSTKRRTKTVVRILQTNTLPFFMIL